MRRGLTAGDQNQRAAPDHLRWACFHEIHTGTRIPSKNTHVHMEAHAAATEGGFSFGKRQGADICEASPEPRAPFDPFDWQRPCPAPWESVFYCQLRVAYVCRDAPHCRPGSPPSGYRPFHRRSASTRIPREAHLRSIRAASESSREMVRADFLQFTRLNLNLRSFC